MKNKWLHRLGSLKLGIVLLVLVALCVIVGTVVVQKPMAEPGQIESLYSPTKLKIYGALDLFDLFHSWWFTALLTILMANITAASAIRLPVVWREVRRHREPEEKLMRAMPNTAEIGANLDDVAGALRSRHYKIKTVQLSDGRRGLTADKQRYARLAPYFVHLSLLVILLGGVIDSRLGYRAYMRLSAGEQRAVAQKMTGNVEVQLPFAIRCDATDMEQYPDGSPKRYWSKLTVVEDGRDMTSKEIEVNSPLVYKGIRFFQANFGRSGRVDHIQLGVSPKAGDQKADASSAHAAGAQQSPHSMAAGAGQPDAAQAPAKIVSVSLNSETDVPDYGMKIRMTGFYPDFFIDGDVPASRSDEPNNPAVRLEVTRGEEKSAVWVFANYPQFNSSKLPFSFALRDLQLGNYTGLQVASEPGQWLVWGGCTVLAFGFFWAFFFAHRQYWAVEEGGRTLLLAGMTSKHHEDFRDEFRMLVESLPQKNAAAAAR